MNGDILRGDVEPLNVLTPVLVLVAFRVQFDVVLAQNDLRNGGAGPLAVCRGDDVPSADQRSSAVVDRPAAHPGSQECHEGVGSPLRVLTSDDEPGIGAEPAGVSLRQVDPVYPI